MNEKTAEQIAKEILAKAKGKTNGKTPPPHVERSEGAALLDDVSAFLKRFIAYPSEHAHIAHVLWIAHTHLMAAWESTPRHRVSFARASIRQNALDGGVRAARSGSGGGGERHAGLSVPQMRQRGRAADDLCSTRSTRCSAPKAKENEELRALLNRAIGAAPRPAAAWCAARIIETEEISRYARRCPGRLGLAARYDP